MKNIMYHFKLAFLKSFQTIFSKNKVISEHITGSIASFPPRIDALRKVVDCVLPQVDTLNVYLNEYHEIPHFLRKNHKIKVFLGNQNAGDLKDNGKFFVSDSLKTGYHFTFDDDIIYPSDYIKKMVSAIEAFGRSCIIGVHGSNYKQNATSYIKNREVYHFKNASSYSFVDMLGTGTTAYHTDSFKISLSDLKTTGSVDLWFAVKAKQTGVGMLVIERPKDWLKVIPLETENLYQHARDNDAYLFALLRDNLFPLLINRYYLDYCNFKNSKYKNLFLSCDFHKKQEDYEWDIEKISNNNIIYEKQ